MSGGGGATSPVLVIRDEGAFYRRLGSGTAGLAEAYMAGAWDSDDLPGLFTVLAENITTLVPAPLQALRRWYIPREPAAEDATIEGARRNIERHYDLSDDLFALFLDPTMTYSSALFAPGDTLAGAQRRKVEHAAGPDRSRPRHHAAGDRHRLGRTGDPRRHPRRPGDHSHHLPHPVGHRPPRAPPQASPPRWTSSCATTVRPAVSMT